METIEADMNFLREEGEVWRGLPRRGGSASALIAVAEQGYGPSIVVATVTICVLLCSFIHVCELNTLQDNFHSFGTSDSIPRSSPKRKRRFCPRIREFVDYPLLARDEIKRVGVWSKDLGTGRKSLLDTDKMEKRHDWSGKRKAEAALKAAEKKMKEMKSQLPVTQKKLDESQLYLDLKRAANAERQSFLARMMQKMQELRLSHDKMQRTSSEVTKAEQDPNNVKRNSQKVVDLLKRFEIEVFEMLQQMLKDTQAELNQKLLETQEHDYKKRIAEEDYKRLKQEESALNSGLEALSPEKLPKRQVQQQIHSVEQSAATMEKVDFMIEGLREGRVAVASLPRLACDRVQTPSPGPFNSNVLKWFSEEAYIPTARVKDFIEGEEHREGFECKFTIRKTEDRFETNGKKLVRYWCSYGPVDLRKEAAQSVPEGNIPEVGEGCRPLSQRKKLGSSSARGCRCHFAVIYLKDRPEACLIRWLNREHRDKDGGVCHGRLETTAPSVDDRSLYYTI